MLRSRPYTSATKSTPPSPRGTAVSYTSRTGTPWPSVTSTGVGESIAFFIRSAVHAESARSSHVAREAASANVGVEFCGTSISSRSGNAARSTVDGWLAENPHFSFANNQAKGYGVCEFTPSQLTTTLRVVDDVTRKDAAISTLASFAVKPGRAVVERV